MEISATPDTVPGLVSKLERCVMANLFTLFPLPDDYNDVHDYFRDDARRKKRSHVAESPSSKDFYQTDIPVYKKLHTLDDCGYYLALKQELAKDLVARHLDLDVDREHAENLHSFVDLFFHSAFHNSSKSPTDFPKYQPCMDLLEKMKGSMFDDIDTVVNALDEFSRAGSMTALMGSITLLANTADAADFDLPDFEDVCLWPLDYLGTHGPDFLNFLSSARDFQSSYSQFPTIVVSFTNLGDYTYDMHKYMNDDIIPHMEVIDDYLKGNASKIEMSEKFSSFKLKKALQILDSLAVDFASFGREFDQGVKSLVFHVKEAFAYIFNSTFPLINNNIFWDLELVKTMHESGLPQLVRILDTYHQGESLQQIIFRLIDQISQDYAKTMNELKLRLPAEIEEMIIAITLMRDELEAYAEEIKMNQAFFM